MPPACLMAASLNLVYSSNVDHRSGDQECPGRLVCLRMCSPRVVPGSSDMPCLGGGTRVRCATCGVQHVVVKGRVLDEIQSRETYAQEL